MLSRDNQTGALSPTGAPEEGDVHHDKKSRLAAVATAVLLLFATGGGVAVAVAGLFSGGPMTQHIVRTEDAPSTYNGSAFQTFSATSVAVPSGTSRMITARFTAESQCTGNSGSWCTIRMVIRNNTTGALTEMSPRSGTDFAFDAATASNDLWESHSVERTIRLGPGNYTVLLQRAVVGVATLRVDDWTFTVDVNA